MGPTYVGPEAASRHRWCIHGTVSGTPLRCQAVDSVVVIMNYARWCDNLRGVGTQAAVTFLRSRLIGCVVQCARVSLPKRVSFASKTSANLGLRNRAITIPNLLSS